MSRTIVWSMELRSLGLANATILGTLSSVKYEHLFSVIYSDLTRTYGLMKQHTDRARSITTWCLRYSLLILLCAHPRLIAKLQQEMVAYFQLNLTSQRCLEAL